MCTFSHTCEGQMLTSSVFLDCSTSCLWRQVLSFNLRARQFGVAGMQVNSRECTCLHSSNPMLSYQTCAKMHSDYIGDVDLNLGNMPVQHILYLLGHHPAP